ncbi:uncharacterized protein LOC130825990 isoform X2 [Amaranthus tricolor]|uniref:uncharacterized protein LOC130825990 isoform X2 n=1 Tax=Amaranthus tricolor TaxID=29722 RepID=UPI00258723C6|nr:uncharacterized protein LOC130825990 isoform X2 [Amaranthus tricolor]
MRCGLVVPFWISGILGVGLAGVLLFAGITSAALSIGKRSSSRTMPEMKPLTEEQEVLTSEETYREAENNYDVKNITQDEANTQNSHHLESKAGTNNDLSLSSEPADVSQREYLDEANKESLSVQEESTSDTNNLDTITMSPDIPQIENIDDSVVASSTVDSRSTIVVSKTEYSLDVGLSENEQRETLTASQTDASMSTLQSSSSVAFLSDSEVLDNSASAVTPETDSNTRGKVLVVPLVVSKEDSALSFPAEIDNVSIGTSSSMETAASGAASFVAKLSADEQRDSSIGDAGRSVSESQSSKNPFTSRGIPAPSMLSAALRVTPGKVLVPAINDQTQSQALMALQVLKVIESDAQPGDICTRREYARWLVSASSALSRNLILKVYPAMYIENVTELAFDDIGPEDSDFTAIQGLAEAGLISSKLSKHDMLSSTDGDIGSFYFHPDSPLSRQDVVTWKMALEKRPLPEADREVLRKISGFIDINRIDPDACPALVADLSAADQGIVALAFGYTRLFQPDKPVTKGQAAIALTTGEAAEVVSEELARIEADSIADKAVAAHNALVAEVEKDINASFEKELMLEKEKIDAVQKMAEEAMQEVERLRAEREEKHIVLMKERATVESEMGVLSRVRNELEEQLQNVMSNKVEISYEKERIEKLKKETEEENQAIIRLQYELEVERKALSIARAWAEDEAKRVQEHAKALEEARDRWERKGLKVVVDENLLEEASPDTTWTTVGKKLSVEETAGRAETLMDKLKFMARKVGGKSKELINEIIQKIQSLVLAVKEWIFDACKRTTEFKDVAVAKVGGSVQELQQNAAGFGTTLKEGTKRAFGDCREGVEKLTQRFKM